MEVREQHSRERGEHFTEVVGEAVMARCRFTGIDEFFLAEDLDAGGGGDEADCDADEDGHERDGTVVYAGREDGVGGEEEAAEVDAFGFELGEADEEAAEGGEEDFEEERRAEAVLLDEGADEAVVDLFVEGGAAGLDAAVEGERFGCFVVAGGVEGRGGWESGDVCARGRSSGIGEGAGAAGGAFIAESSRLTTLFPIVDERPDARITRGFIKMALAGNDVHDGVGGVASGREGEAQALEVGLGFSFGALINDTTFAEKEKGVEGFEDLRSRLMDDCDDSDVEPGELF